MLTLPLVAFAAHALEPVVLTGDAAPGLPGSTFFDLGGAAINAQGEVAFDARTVEIAGPPWVRGVWRPDGIGGFAKVLQVGDAAPGITPATTLGNVFWPTVDDAGRVSFWVNANSSPVRKALYATDAAGSVIKVAAEGGTVPGAPAGTSYAAYPGPPTTQINPSGEITAEIYVHTPLHPPELSPGVAALFVPDGPGAIQLGFMEGDIAPGTPSEVFQGFHDVLMDAAGGVAFRGSLTLQGSVSAANDSGVWASDGSGGFALVVREGDPTPLPGRSYGSMRDLVSNAAGELAVGDIDSGVGIWRVGPSGITLAYESGSAAPGTGGFVFEDVAPRAMDAQGRLLLQAELVDPLAIEADISGYWVEETLGTVALVAAIGLPAAGADPGVVYSALSPPQMNEAGEIILRATVAGPGVDLSNDRMIVARDLSGAVRPLVREGDMIEVAQGDTRLATSVFINDGEGPPFTHDQLGDSGHALISIHFSDGSEGHFVENLRAGSTQTIPMLGALAGSLLALVLGATGIWVRRPIA